MHNDIKKYELVDRLNLDRYVSTQTGIESSTKLGNQCVAATWFQENGLEHLEREAVFRMYIINISLDGIQPT